MSPIVDDIMLIQWQHRTIPAMWNIQHEGVLSRLPWCLAVHKPYEMRSYLISMNVIMLCKRLHHFEAAVHRAHCQCQRNAKICGLFPHIIDKTLFMHSWRNNERIAKRNENYLLNLNALFHLNHIQIVKGKCGGGKEI